MVDNDFDDYPRKFEDNIKAIHEYLKEKRYRDVLSVIRGISNEISENIYRPFSEEQDFIIRKILSIYDTPINKVSDASPWLDIFLFIKKYNFANVHTEIFGYIYENYLKDLYGEENRGQYFTDSEIVKFMLQQVGYTPENIKKRDKNSISIIDPACGSGTFLYSAVDSTIKSVDGDIRGTSKEIMELVNNNVFGLDIAEFPLYLAEMSILMRMLPFIINDRYNNPVDKKIKLFLTEDSIAEFRDAFYKGQKQTKLSYPSFHRDIPNLKEMKESLITLSQCPRRRFDFVIGNPPYISYNECCKQNILIFDLIKQKRAKLNDIYSVNLHSTPEKRKRYRPNPNLYAFFIALGLALLKDSGKLCYIIPQTILTAGDLDVLRYHLAKFTTIEKIITFSGKMFIGRGLKQNKPVPTSSLIFVVNQQAPRITHQVEVINYKNPDDSIEEALQNILEGKNISEVKILQSNLLQNVVNWNFIKGDKAFLDFYEEYKENTDDVSIYYKHVLAEPQFKNKFYFDSGYSIDEKRLLKDVPNEKYFYYPKLKANFWTVKDYRGYWTDLRKGNSPLVIKLRQANQGYHLLDSKQKIIWSYTNPSKFHFTSMPVIWARNQICAIGSNNKNEILYLFALLNSPIINLVLDANLKSKNEKDFLVSTTAVKEFVRVPKITEDTKTIKNEIIKRTEELLALEDKTLSNLVDFSDVMMQKFDGITVEGGNLVLTKGGEKIECKIKSDIKLIEQTITEKYSSDKLKREKQKISLPELKSLPVADFEKQKALKDYIDDLVYALYFNVPLQDIGLEKAKLVKEACGENEFYKITSAFQSSQ